MNVTDALPDAILLRLAQVFREELANIKDGKDSLAILEAWADADPSRGFVLSYGNGYAEVLTLTLHYKRQKYKTMAIMGAGSLESQVRGAIAKFEEEWK